MRRSIVLFAAAMIIASPTFAAEPPFLMKPVEPPPGWHYEGCSEVEKANGKPVMGGSSCRFERNEPDSAQKPSDRQPATDTPRRDTYNQPKSPGRLLDERAQSMGYLDWITYCSSNYLYDSDCPQPRAQQAYTQQQASQQQYAVMVPAFNNPFAAASLRQQVWEARMQQRAAMMQSMQSRQMNSGQRGNDPRIVSQSSGGDQRNAGSQGTRPPQSYNQGGGHPPPRVVIIQRGGGYHGRQ